MEALCIYPELRKRAVEHALRDEAGGYGIGGLAVGEPTEKMYEMLELLDPLMPQDKPRYLMGVGTPGNILNGILRGIDMFDCVFPLKGAQHGNVYTRKGRLRLLAERFRDDERPIDEACSCPACSCKVSNL